jgi:hypothetical protein
MVVLVYQRVNSKL